jgi:hypothetical protein
MRRIGVLIAFAEDDPETKARLAGFRQGLGEWWVPGGRSAAALWQILLRTPRNCVPKDTVPFEVPHCLWSR